MGTWRQLWGEAADLVFPQVCPGCGSPTPWCPGCAATVAGPAREPALGDFFLDRWPHALPVIRSLSRYQGPARAAIVAGKERGRRDLPPLLGSALGRGMAGLIRLGLLPRSGVLVPAPSSPWAARARGGDPVLAMARSMLMHPMLRSWQVAPCVYKRWGTRDSVGLTAAERLQNLRGRIATRRRRLPTPDRFVVVVDDVFTSGATVLATADALAQQALTVGAVLTVAAVGTWRSP